MTGIAGENFAGRLVERMGSASCLIDAATGQTIGSRDLPGLIRAYSASLLSLGLSRGDRILIGCALSPLTALVYLGAVYAGLIAVPVEDREVRASAAALLEITGAKAVWTETPLPAQGSNETTVLRRHGELGKEPLTASPPASCAASDLAALMATSGSTGLPRFVMVTHGNLIANTEAIIRSQGLNGDDRAMLVLPLSYCFGASVLHTHLYQGSSVVFDRRFMFPDKVMHAINEFGCTTFAGVPTAYHTLLRRLNIRSIALPRLQRFLQAGGALAPQKISQMRTAFPSSQFYVMYGQTEATARISCLEPERWEEKRGSVGRPLDNLMVSIVDDNGMKLPAGQVGELLVKGPSVCAGYWNDPEATRSLYSDGWLRTGDLARQDDEGYLWVEGRKSAFVKMRGIRVSFAEVEERVNAIAGVIECAVRAVDHAEAGEALVLFIVPEEGTRVLEEEVRRRLPAHWALDSIRLVAELPKTSAGKIAFSALPD